MRYRFASMDDPLCMAYMQAQMDAAMFMEDGIPLTDAVGRTLERMKYLFGDTVPARLVYTAIRRSYRCKAREEVAR